MSPRHEKPKRKMSTLKIVLLATVASLLFVAISIGVSALALLKLKEAEFKAIEANVIAAREAYDQTGGGINRLRIINTLQETKTITMTDESVNYASRFDTCYLGSVTQGDTPTSWYQACHMRHVDMFETSLSLGEIKTKLTQKGAQVEEDGDNPSVDADICTPLHLKVSGVKTSLVYVPTGKIKSSVGKNRAEHLCSPPHQTTADFTNEEQIKKEYESITKKYYSFDESRIDASKAYLYIVRDDEYYHKDLGCSGFMTCESPREEPISGF